MSAVAVKLLEKCTAQGISLRPGEGFKLKVRPPPERLPEDLREELKRHKAEILALLRQSQPAPSDLSSTPAGIWLLNQLSAGPRRVSALIKQWGGGERDGVNGRWSADLNEARQRLRIEAFIGEDGGWWWRMPAFPLIERESDLTSWRCPHCGRPATIQDVDCAVDGEWMLTFWACAPCHTVGVTPDEVKQPPVVTFHVDAREEYAGAHPAWNCPACGGLVELQTPRQEDAPTRFWTCTQCSSWGATREGAPTPVVWVSRSTMQ